MGGVMHTVSGSHPHLRCPIPDWNQSSPPPPSAHLALWADCLKKEPYIPPFPSFYFSLFSIQLCSFGSSRVSLGKERKGRKHSLLCAFIFYLRREPLGQVWLGFSLRHFLWFSQQCSTAGLCSCGFQGRVVPLLGGQLLSLRPWFCQVSTVLANSCLQGSGPLTGDPSRET